jgi:hypothetical protein
MKNLGAYQSSAYGANAYQGSAYGPLAAGVVVPPGPFGNHATLGTGLLHAWLFEVGGTNFADEVGGLTVAPGGSSVGTFPTGPFGRAVEIDGNDQEAIYADATGLFTLGASDYTLAAVWENRNVYDDKTIIALYAGSTARFTLRSSLASNDSILARAVTDASAFVEAETSALSPVGTGKWFLTVARWTFSDRKVRASFVKITDSGFAHSAASSALSAGAITPTQLRIGETGAKKSAIDEAYIWSRALTDQEIIDLAASGGYAA